MLHIKKTLGSIFLLTTIWHGAIQAQGVKMYSGAPPSAEEMANILFSQPENNVGSIKPGGIKMRSISFGKAKKPEPTYAQATPQNKNSVGLPIKFGYNSSDILPESLPFLDEIGRMLAMADYAQKKLVVEGHTDASGSKGYNQYLSERRAESVKAYLMGNHNIADNRLFVNGMGENQPLPDMDAYAAVNRRVQFYSAP